nr:phospholipase D-like domain-containing protein [Ornithinibacillus caprae]
MIENEIKHIKEDGTQNIEKIIHHVIEKFKQDRVSFANVRHIKDAEIRGKFIEALQTAQYELCIISPWLGSWIFNNQFLSNIQDACKRGVTIKILYGINDQSKENQRNNRSIKTEELANSLKKKLAKYVKQETFKMKRTNTHFKLVICDDRFYLIGSYNFLSFEGKYDEYTRGEGIEYSENKEMIKEYKERYFDF